jgi:hypothetical protein
MTRIFILMLVVMSSKSAFGADLSNGDLTKACQQKTMVYSQKGEPVAETIDSFCSGYLRGSLYTLLNISNIKCASSLVNDQTPEGLLSIYLTYQKDKNIAASVAAAPTLLSAYERAFGCESN